MPSDSLPDGFASFFFCLLTLNKFSNGGFSINFGPKKIKITFSYPSFTRLQIFDFYFFLKICELKSTGTEKKNSLSIEDVSVFLK